MDRFQYELLKSVKDKYERAGGHAEYECEQSGPDKSARQFYVRNLRDNFVRSMDSCHEEQYRRGSGRELDDKMRALRSSSAMTFNLIGNKYCVIDENDLGLPHGRYSVEYEHQAPTLKASGGTPANIDAWLESDCAGGVVIACELKMMEWLTSNPSLFKDKYLDPANYRHGVGDMFAGLAEKLKLERFLRYDWAQMFKHTVALMNEMLDCRCGERISTLVLLNVVWEPVRSTFHQTMAERYYEKLSQERVAKPLSGDLLRRPVRKREDPVVPARLRGVVGHMNVQGVQDREELRLAGGHGLRKGHARPDIADPGVSARLGDFPLLPSQVDVSPCPGRVNLVLLSRVSLALRWLPLVRQARKSSLPRHVLQRPVKVLGVLGVHSVAS